MATGAGVIAVVDTSAVLKRLLGECDFEKGYVPPGVLDEIRDGGSREYFKLYSHKIEVRSPSDASVAEVRRIIAETGDANLSPEDTSVCALAIDLAGQASEPEGRGWITPETIATRKEVICLTGDLALSNVLRRAGIWTCGAAQRIQQKRHVARCYACGREYPQGEGALDFCKTCGYSTITKVSYREGSRGERILNFSKDYAFKPRTIRTARGKEIRSEDQREYRVYAREKAKEQRRSEYALKSLASGWEEGE